MKIRFVLTRDENIPTGGVRQAYRQVDILNELGYDAAIVSARPGFRCSWFENETRIVDPDDSLETGDFLVLSEILPCMPEMPGADKANVIIYAQNPFGIFRGYGGVPKLFDFYKNRVAGVMCVSGHSLGLLNNLFPETPSHRISYSFDKPPFGPSTQKERLVVYMTRRRREDVETALMIAGGKQALRGWRIESVSDKSEAEVAGLMRRAMVFVAGGHQEGFGMPAAEAMACGCVVVGWHGHGGMEFMLPGVSYPIPEGDYITCATTLVEVLKTDFKDLVRQGDMASEYIRSTYSTKREIESVKTAWDAFTHAKEETTEKDKVAAFVSTYDEGPYLKSVLKFLSPRVGRVYVVESESTFYGAQKPEGERRTKRIVDEVTSEGVNNIVYRVLEGKEHPSPDIKEAHERNQALEMIERDGFEWVWIVDSDELYTEAGADALWKWFLKVAKDNPDVLGAKCSWYTYWRSVHWRIDPPEPFRPNVIIRSSCRIASSRHLLPHQQKKIVDVSETLCMVHHYSWAHTPEHVRRKISTWTHAHQVEPGWFENVFMAWQPGSDMHDLHPVEPSAYKRVVKADRIPEALEGHAYVGQQVIQDKEKRIKVVILNHNQPENSDKLYEQLEHHFDVEIFDSGSDPDKIPVHVGRALDNVYWAGGWNEILGTCRDYDAVWMLGCDITLKQEPSEYRRAIEASLPFGCWSPCIEGRAKPFMQEASYGHGEPKMVRNIEGMALAVSREFMREVKELPEGSDGYGQDLWMCMRARQMGLPNIIDGRVCVFHPEGTGYSDKKFHDQMEKVFGEMFGPDFRRTAFEYDDRYEQNLVGAPTGKPEHATEGKRFTIVTVDNGWGYPEFMRVTSHFPDARKIVMTKGIADIPPSDGTEQIPYDDSLSRLIQAADVALFPKVGISTRKDMEKLMRAGIPCVIHQDFGADVEHMKNGFVYQNTNWAMQWIASIRDNPAHRKAVEDYQWPEDEPVQVPVQEPSEMSLVGAGDIVRSCVTVVTPTWNRDPAIVKRCIDSFRLQTEKSWTQLVCSNGPEEKAIRGLVESIGDSRVRYCHLNAAPKNGDFGNSARAAVIQAANSPYIMFCDDDNIVLPTFIEEMRKALRADEDADFALCDIMHFGPLNEKETGMKPPVVLTGEPVKLYYVDPLQVFVKTKVMQEAGWDTSVGYLSDGVSLERMAKDRKYVRVQKVLGVHV